MAFSKLEAPHGGHSAFLRRRFRGFPDKFEYINDFELEISSYLEDAINKQMMGWVRALGYSPHMKSGEFSLPSRRGME
jgi:hypothetical protein